jgi:Zn-dependent M28 family amino/carboxypeptidase
LFTGAEETGLHGAEAFAALHRSVGEVRSASPVAGGAGAAQPGLRGQRVAILNLDMVGAGDRLTYVLQDGALRVHATDAALNQLVRAADPEARGILNKLRSGDYLPFLRRGLATTSLETRGARDAELAYHTVRDTVEVIDIARLGATAQTVIAVVATAEARGYPERKV